MMMSAIPFLLGWILFIVLGLFINSKSDFKIPVWKFAFISLPFVFLYAAFQPSNTYKFRVERIENPPLVEKIVPEIQLTKPLIEQNKEERQKRFDDLTSWRKNVE